VAEEVDCGHGRVEWHNCSVVADLSLLESPFGWYCSKRWCCPDALNVNWLAVTIADEKGKATYDGALVTSLPVTAENVVEIAACARARWKIENESFNVLKNNGYNLAHNFGHGKKYLAGTLAAMNLLAFAFHTACYCLEILWQQARQAVGARARFFQDLHTITTYVLFPSGHCFMITVATGKAPPI
jgi:hypothetical protein